MPACLPAHAPLVAQSSIQWATSLQIKVTSRSSSRPLRFVPFLEQQSHCFSYGGVSSEPTCTSSLRELSHLAY